jgi:hypothetical protein
MAAAKPRERKPTDIKAEDHPEQRRRAGAAEVIDFRDSCRQRLVLERDTVFRIQRPRAAATGIQLKIQQDGVGGHAATFDVAGNGNAPIRWEGEAPDLTLTEPGKVCLIEFDFEDGALVGSVLVQNLLFA